MGDDTNGVLDDLAVMIGAERSRID